MREIYIRKWFNKKTINHFTNTKLEDTTTTLFKVTDKAIAILHGVYNSNVDLIRTETIWMPKTALLIASSEEEANEKDIGENKEILLAEVEKYLATTNLPKDYEEAKNYIA